MLQKLLNHPVQQRIGQWLRTTKLFRGTVSLYDILVNLTEKILVHDIDQRATAVAFSLTLASFPAIIFLFTLIPYIPIEDLDAQIMELLRELIPRGIYVEANQTIQDIVSRPRRGVLSVGFLLTLVTATNGMVSLMRAFNMVYRDVENRSFLKTRAIALMLTLLLAVVLFVAVVLLIVGDRVMAVVADWNVIRDAWIFMFVNVTRYLITLTMLTVAVSIIYRFAPNRSVRMSFFNIGSLVASALIVLSTYAFSFYLSNFGSYNKLYGSIGTMIAFMIWLYLIALLLIFGFEINASIIMARRSRPPHEQ
ncbi:YihY/virulence factor BrkB family protein [Telluribacter sp. SYSU D00476]|uniref:YihY/virulence factor BrkB family protein n=1 Tax=Telluribacter sp. SYSU D00476 TaxID=2811430 RepID=UPI001FF30350|nr:YihY/virulence factor BrkB family protein [Telluribacter sp. SYSU D00476]